MRTTITITLPQEMKNELDSLIKEENKSRSFLVQKAINDFLFLKKYKSVSKKLSEKAEFKGIYSDEDVFEKLS